MFNTHAEYYKINLSIDELSARDCMGYFLLARPVGVHGLAVVEVTPLEAGVLSGGCNYDST